MAGLFIVSYMNVARVALVGAAVLLVAVVATGGAVGQDQVTLTVSVADQDGDAVGGVAVEAEWETESGETGTATGTTASNGQVLLDVPEGSSVELDIDDDTYVRNTPLRIDNATERDVDLGVSRSGTATVSVVDAENQSQADARVTVRSNGRTIDRGDTDSEGQYETARLERGTYEVNVVKPGYYETEREVTVSRNTEVTVGIERGTVTLDFRTFDDHFDPPRPIETGSVRVSSSVYNAEVSVTEGSASLNVPVNTAYTVEVVKDEYDASPERIRVRESPTSLNVTAQRTPTLSVTPANDRVLVGETTRVTVRNAYDEPVANVTVAVDGEEVGETDERGEIDVPISSAGNRTIVAQDGDVESDPATVEGVDTAAEADPGANGSNGSDTDDDDSADTDDGAPGFGVVAAVLALLAAAAAAGRRRTR
jgi:PGF-CTERM protein